MRAPLVSILIPAFNAQEWIADTIRSAIAQTWPREEIIVVDDGSTDRTVAIARQFESDSVRIITQENQGAAAARNKAFSLSQGEYIQWLDADDLLSPNKIALQMEAAAQCPSKRTLLSSGFTKFIYRWYRAGFVPTDLWNDLSPAEFLVRKMGQNLYMQTAVWLVSRELTEAAGPWDTSMLSDDDGEYFCRVLLKSDGIRFVPGAKVYYRVAGFQSLGYVDQSDRKREALWESMQLHIRYLRSMEDSPRSRRACLAYLQKRLISFYPDRLDIVKAVERVATDLEGQLTMPHLSWKYAWIKTLCGWFLAQRASSWLQETKFSLRKSLDKTLFRIENARAATSLRGPRVESTLGEEEARLLTATERHSGEK
jgi:glycosyltransferase involved in cell wall biosynthesis